MESNDTQELAKLVDKIQFAMMTTVSREDGSLRSRPMTLQPREFDGDFWFFVGRHSTLAEDLLADSSVNLAFADPAHSRYVSVTGMGELVEDKAMAAELWTPALRPWFPGGLADPELALVRVQSESADFWESPSSNVVRLVGFAKTIFTGKPASDMGTHAHIGSGNILGGPV